MEDRLHLNLRPDKLEIAIERLIQCLGELELLMMAVMDGREVLDPQRFEFLQRRKAALEGLVDEEFLRAPLASLSRA